MNKPDKSIRIGDDVLQKWKEIEDAREYTSENPPDVKDCIQAPGGLYRAPDGSLWEMAPECVLRPFK